MPCKGVIQRPKFSSFSIIYTSQVLNEYFKQNDNKVVSNNEPTKKIVSERHEKHERSRNTTLSVAFFLHSVWSLLFYESPS